MNPNWLTIVKKGERVILTYCLEEAEGEIVIPEGVTEIGECAFNSGCAIRSVIIPDSVKVIGRWAFAFCRELQEVVIGNSVTKIGEKAFWECTNLKGVIIPESVTSIGNNAFCYSEYYGGNSDSYKGILDYVLIGGSVADIGENAFGLFKPYAHYDKLEPWVKIENIPSGYYALYCQNDVDFMQIPSYIKKIVTFREFYINISVLDFAGEISETYGKGFLYCKIKKLRINTPRKQTIIPEDIGSALDNTKFSTVVYAVPELCNEESQVSGYIRCTLARNDELVDINTKYILSVEPVELDCYHPHIGSRISCAVCGNETHYDYIVYEPCDMVLKKIEHSLCQLSKRVGGIAGLLNQIETLANDKCSNK